VSAGTPEEFADDLDDGLQWRRSELASLRTAVEKLAAADETKPYGRMLLRAGVALLYAHWEGYAKESCQHYLDYVALRKLKYTELSRPFAMTALRPLSERAGKVPDDLSRLLDLVLREGDERARMPRQGVVETGSNLRYDTFVRILGHLGLDPSPFETRQQLIDQRLCDGRNDIAHGKAVFPTRESLLELQEIVIDMMEKLRSQLIAAVFAKAYRAERVAP
jgi:hypothetical protein